jgi:hypothetical protein
MWFPAMAEKQFERDRSGRQDTRVRGNAATSLLVFVFVLVLVLVACRAFQQGRLWEEIKSVESGRELEAEAVP